jgi:3-phosphoshikimate 1-carboxyvinyltransferase
VRPFTFVGKLPASKSILNRLLLAQSYFPALLVNADSDCDDVRFMRRGLEQMLNVQPIDVGAAGTVLRFLALRASRLPGRHRLVGHPRLFERPQDELIRIFRQIGVQADLRPDGLEIESAGWKMHGDTLLVSSQRSSQFASAVLLNAWDLPFDLYVSQGGQRVSEGYWRMSVQIAQKLGMRIDFWDADFRVPKGQKPAGAEFLAEIDMSSAFALAAVAAVSGQATFLEYPSESLQPDAAFPAILERMGAGVFFGDGKLKIEKTDKLNGVAVNLKSAPDLFPVLAALCAMAHGESDLFGAPQLVHKESNRVAQVARLLRACGREVEEKPDGLRITGAVPKPDGRKIVFDTDHDHRLAFAAAVLKARGFEIEIQHPEVVSKSFPAFWRTLGWS